MPDPRNYPERGASYGHQYEKLHKRVVEDVRPDDTFNSKVPNNNKVEYICEALRLKRRDFNLDLPLPIEDWLESDDMSMLIAGLYFVDLRRQFYEVLMNTHHELAREEPWTRHAACEFFSHQFSDRLARKQSGYILSDDRVKH